MMIASREANMLATKIFGPSVPLGTLLPVEMPVAALEVECQDLVEMFLQEHSRCSVNVARLEMQT
jgi:hypothetical protein